MSLKETDRTHHPASNSSTQASSSRGASSTLLDDVWELSEHRDGSRLSPARAKGLWFKVTPKRYETPSQIANEIRRLRGHAKLTVYQRHRKFNEGDESYPHSEELVPLCMRLVALAGMDADNEKPNASLKEIYRLYPEDPVVYYIFQDCIRENTSKSRSSEGRNVKAPDTNTAKFCYRRWSNLLGNCSFKSIDSSETKQSNCDALKDSFAIDQYLQLASEFIPYAMALKAWNEDLEFLRQIWDQFLNCVAERSEVETSINNLDLCFRSIVNSGKPWAYFASPLQLGRIAKYLFLKRYIWTSNGDPLYFIFQTFFWNSDMENKDPKRSPYRAEFHYNGVVKLDIVTASKYAMAFLTQISREPAENSFYIDALHGSVKSSSGQFESYVPFSYQIPFYQIVDNAAFSYRCAGGVLGDGKLEPSIRPAFVSLVENRVEYVAKEVSERSLFYQEDLRIRISRANFTISHTVDIDRYHKHEILERLKENDAYIDVVNDRLRFHAYLERPDGICNLTFIPQFRNVPYLRRFRTGSNTLISADSIPDAMNKLGEYFSEGLNIDTMHFNGQLLTCLRVDNESPVFRCDGHYPILAGGDPETADPFYIAVVHQEVDSPWYFTTAKDGASSVEYTNEVGERLESSNFFVLALRHDPIDLPPQDIRHRAAAKDPTGPLYWVEFWPTKDVHYFDDERLRDDRLLKSFLEDLRERKTAESILGGFD